MTDLLSISSVTKRFGALTANDHIDLTLRAGEIHALIGPNGAGKSTLIQIIAGGLQPDSGTVMFDGEPINGLDVAGRARLGLARTFQISALAPDLTVLQNIALAIVGHRSLMFRWLKPVLDDAGLIDDARAAADRVGLLSHLSVVAGDLAHGERRRLEVALALALRPKLFLMDEPMAGMGPDGARAMTDLLMGLKSDAPILLVEHDMDAVFRLADRISVMVNGAIIAAGAAADIRANPAVQTAYLGKRDGG